MVEEKYLKIIKALASPEYFITEILGYEVKDFHKEWLEAFQKYNFINLLAPRGHGKTALTAGFILWLIITNPKIRILIVTVNQSKADEMMNTIKDNLSKNEKLTDLFGNQVGGLWSASKIRVKRAGWAHKEPTVQVLGVSSSQVSSHYDLIVLDDIVDEKNSTTELRRREVKNWYQSTLWPMLEPGGRVINIGTRWHADDFHHYLSECEEFKTLIYKAIIQEPVDGKEPIVLWPERFPYYDEVRTDENGNEIIIKGLKTIRDKMIGQVAFEMQYQNQIVQTADSPIQFDWVREATEKWDESKIPVGIRTYLGVDLAAGKGKESDFFAIVVIGIDKNENVYILDTYRDKLTMSNQLSKIFEFDYKYNPVKIGIESVAGQKIVTDEWRETTDLPIVPMKSSWVNDRHTRVQRLSVLFETGRITLSKRHHILIDELLSFPRGQHDDCLDALCFAYQAHRGQKSTNWQKLASIIKSR